MRYIEACELDEWSVMWWKEQEPEKKQVAPFRCRSWRHEGACREWKGAQDFHRMRVALQSRADWLYIVLTFPQNDWPEKDALYRHGVKCWSKLRKRLVHRFGPIAYMQTWEKHTISEGPHVNIALSNEAMFAACAGDGWKDVRRDWLQFHAADCGFGYICWLEAMREPEQLAGYLTKLARELTGAGVKNQVPTNAPKHFRRIRASRGLLPPPYKDPLTTGRLCSCSADIAAEVYAAKLITEQSLPLPAGSDPVYTKQDAEAVV